MKKWILTLALVALVGCESQTETGSQNYSPTPDAPRSSILAVLHSSNDGEIAETILNHFQQGAPAEQFKEELAHADRVESMGNLTKYTYFVRGKEPKNPGDGWVEVRVNNANQIIDGSDIWFFSNIGQEE